MDFVIQDQNAGENMIKDLFGTRIRSLLNSAVIKGYELAHSTKDNTSYLSYSKSRGKDILPYLKNYAVEFAIIKYIESGLLPFDFEIKYNRTRSSRFFILFDTSRKMELCVNQVSQKKKIGRPAYYRNQRIESFNSYFILSDISNGEIVNDKPVYFELNHGYQSTTPNFVILGIPGKDGKWIDKLEISNEINLVSDTGTIKTKIEEVEEFNFEELQKYIEKSGSNG
ncbi:hypothetical protein SC499_09125 [Peribacillus simplex]|nr:hypothetical protein [Peribacillus simplex]MDW7614888.1 hypothetical protein [Peribacillus simplex]